MKRKVILASAPLLSLTIFSVVVALARPQGWFLVLALLFLVILAIGCISLFSQSVQRALSPLNRLRQVLDYAKRLGIPVPRTAEDQVEELFKDIEQAFDLVLRANSDLEGKVRRRREELESSESRLNRANAFLDSIVENIPDMIFVKDAKDLRFVLFNRAGEELLGYSRHDLIGKNDYDFFPKTEADFFTAKDRQVLNRGKVVVIDEEPIHTRSGLKILHTKKIPLLNSEGEPQYLLGISADVTEKKKSEAKLHQRTRELEQAQIEKDQMELFAYVAAHDLREPAHKISSFGDLLANQLPAEGPAREYLARMQSAAQRMGRLIDDLLRFSKLTREEVGSEIVDLRTILHDVIQDFDLLINKTSGVIEVNDLPIIQGGRVHLQELFRNLIGNALKFRDAARAPEIVIHSETHANGDVSVFIRDNGIGFDPTYSERIFRPFERLHSRKEYDGTGIGLAICQKIAEQMNAKITTLSRPGEGATFTVTFPAACIRQRLAAAAGMEPGA